MKYLITLFALISFGLGVNVTPQHNIDNTNTTNFNILGFDDDDYPELINLGFDDDDYPELINLGFDDDDYPELVNLGFDDDDYPELINI